MDQSFLKYNSFLKKKFKNKKYKNIYVACVDSIITHFILSYADFDNLFTFDDGLGNILFPTDNFYHAIDHPIIYRYIYKIFGNKYSTKKIKKETKKHFTMYKNFKNSISDNCVYIGDIFRDIKLSNSFQYKQCNIVLGTIFKEYFKNESIKKINMLFEKFIKTLTNQIFILPHPRSDESYNRLKKLNNVQIINSNKISEEIIIDLKLKYKNINLYGFCSSAQFNFIYDEGFNHYLIINDEKKSY